MSWRASALVLGLALSTAACPKPLGAGPEPGAASATTTTTTTTTSRLFLGRALVATIEERASGRSLERTSRLVGGAADVARLRVTLDAQGFVTSAAYERRGPLGDRDASLARQRREVVLRTGEGEFVVGGDEPVVLLDVLHHVRPARPTAVLFVDVSSGETLAGSVRREGGTLLALAADGGLLARASATPSAREGPGRFVERQGDPPAAAVVLRPPLSRMPGWSGGLHLRGIDAIPLGALALDGPGQRATGDRRAVVFDRAHKDTSPPRPAHRRAGPFLESGAPEVAAFAAAHGEGSGPAAAALALANAIHALVDTSGGGGPPSALLTLRRRAGDCDDATALLVAALRAQGHAARPVVGYRHHDGSLVPHAWAEVHDGSAWLPVDALVPGLGPFESHLRLFEGLGSPLTMGRVLGALEVEPLAAETAAP